MDHAILGLVSGKTFTDQAFHNRNNRRRIFHDFPVGQFPLTGLLSLMDSEETDSFDFGWWEKRFETPQTTIASGAAPFQTAAGGALTDATFVAGTEFIVLVADSSMFQVRQQVWFPSLSIYGAATTYAELKGVVTAVATGSIKFQCSESTVRLVNTDTAMPNGATGCDVICAGNAVGEGASTTSGRTLLPVNPHNFTQIFRNGMSFTRTAMKVPTNFDKTGIYRESAEEACRNHMVDIEMAFLFGSKRTDNVVENGETVPRRQTGGVTWYLKQWEAADSIYRGGTGTAAVTDNANDNKRIILSTAGNIVWSTMNTYLERAFRVTNDKAFEKLFLCGSGILGAFNAYLEGKAQLQKQFSVQTVYGMNVVSWETPFGTIHFKTHPLFSRQAALRYNGLLLDVQNLKHRPLNDSDTTLLTNRQANDYDGRKDEWMTEAGLELRFPESCMYFQNLKTFSAT